MADVIELHAKLISVRFDVDIKGQLRSYVGTEVRYQVSGGQVNTKNLTSVALKKNPNLRDELAAVAPTDGREVAVVIGTVREGEFVNWVSIGADNSVEAPRVVQQAGGVVTAPTVRSNYETPEERKQRQLLIVRQSSVDYAIKLAALDKGDHVYTLDEVLATAAEIEAHVFREGGE